MMHAIRDPLTVSLLTEGKISRAQHLHLLAEGGEAADGPGSVRFPRTILTNSRARANEKMFRVEKETWTGACQRVIGNCAGLFGPLGLIASYFTESNGRPHSCLAPLIYWPH